MWNFMQKFWEIVDKKGWALKRETLITMMELTKKTSFIDLIKSLDDETWKDLLFQAILKANPKLKNRLYITERQINEEIEIEDEINGVTRPFTIKSLEEDLTVIGYPNLSYSDAINQMLKEKQDMTVIASILINDNTQIVEVIKWHLLLTFMESLDVNYPWREEWKAMRTLEK